MEDGSKLNLPVRRLAAYSTNTWVSPLAVLRITGPLEKAGLDLVRGVEGEVAYPEKVALADAVIIQRDFPRLRKAYREIIGRARAEDKLVIVDLDDWLLELPDEHPDRLSGYYSQAAAPLAEAIMEADAITTTTRLLVESLQELNPNVYLLPNYLDDQIWPLRPPRVLLDPSPEDELRPVVIGYMGGPSHEPDLASIAPALLKVSERYGEKVDFHFVGTQPPEALTALARSSWTPSITFNYTEFAAAFSQLHFDIFIAPLEDNHFNRCKSSIKFLEYSSLGVPGVYSRLETYACVVRSEENGFLAGDLEEWEYALSRLVESPDLRLELGRQAQDTVRREWLLADHAHEWSQAYNEIQAGTRAAHSLRTTRPFQAIIRQAVENQDRQEAQNQALQVRLQDKVRDLQEHTETIHSLEQRLGVMERRLEKAASLLARARASRVGRGLARVWRLPFTQKLLARLRAQPAQTPAVSIPDSSSRGLPDYPPGNESVEGLYLEGIAAQQLDARFSRKAGEVDLIILPVMEWSSRVQRPQQLARQFARNGQRVFFLETSFSSMLPVRVRQLEERIYEVRLHSPQPLSIYGDAMTEDALQAFMEAFTGLKQVFEIVEAAVMVDLPFWTPLALQLRERWGWKVVYDCMDYHAGFSTNQEEMLSQEETLTRQSDLVLVTSRALLEDKQALASHCLLAPNGADYEHFRFPAVRTPEDMEGVPRPIIGYYGAIADWFDAGLVRQLAAAKPDWSFTLIGSTRYSDVHLLEGLPNVFILGEKPYEQLPGYLHSFDAAIIPFKQSLLTHATNPVKMYEYLSAGKPVVATRLDELESFREHVYLAQGTGEWLAALDLALLENSLERVQDRQQFARQNTWETRFQQIRPAIQELYSKASIIIVTYNNLDYTRLCLESVYDKTAYPNFEVIVVDNASVDGTQAYLSGLEGKHENLHCIFNSENEGFARANNLGAAAATGEYLVFLNNDTVVPRTWLSGLLRHLQDTRVGMVGPVTNFSGNESRIPVEYDLLGEMEAFARRYTQARQGRAWPIRMLALYCAAMRRSTFIEVGPFDERYGIGMFEDDDYAIRMRALGYEVLCAEDVFVHHWGRASFSLIEPAQYEHLFEMNRSRFEAKWGITWEPHRYREH